MFVDSEGFSRNGRLIDLEVCVFGDDASIGRNDGTLRGV